MVLVKDALRRQGTSSSSTASTGSSRDALVLDAAQALRAAKRRQGEMGPKFEPTCRADCWSRCRSGAPSSRANACPTPPLHARARRIRSLHICACRDVPCTYVAAVSVDERRTGCPGLCGMEPGLLPVSVGQTRPTETPIHPAKGRKYKKKTRYNGNFGVFFFTDFEVAVAAPPLHHVVSPYT